MNKLHKISALILLAAAASPLAHAQSLHESIDVEGKYKPEFIHRERISVMPQKTESQLEAAPLEYSRTGVTADTDPDFLTLPALALGAQRTPPRNRGYLSLGLGSYLNSDLSAGYRFVDSKTTIAGAALQFNSSSLYKPFSQTDDKRFRYDGTLGLYGSHTFANGASLAATLDYRLAHFNYLAALGARTADRCQSLNNARLALRWSNDNDPERLAYSVGARYEYFGYNRLYFGSPLQETGGAKENRITLDASLDRKWTGGSHIGLDAAADLLIYSAPVQVPADNYGNITLSPYYRFSRGLLNINAGLNLDITIGAGPADKRFDFLHVSPNVRIDYRKDAIGFYLHALGGTQLQTLASLERQDYYQTPAIISTTPLYSPLDCRLGAVIGPFSGFSAELQAAYKIANNRHASGLYLPMLVVPDSYRNPAVPEEYYSLANPQLFTLPQMRGFKFTARLAYKYDRYLALAAQGSYIQRNSRTGYLQDPDNPRWIADVTARISPIADLDINLGFQYRACRQVWYRLPAAPQNDYPVADYTLHAVRLNNLADLNAAVTYRLPLQGPLAISLYAELHNILSADSDPLYCVPQTYFPKINFLAGINFIF